MTDKDIQLSNWINSNREILGKYKGQWIAYDLEGIIAHSKNLRKVINKADQTKKEYTLYIVSRHFDEVRILPIKFRNIESSVWQPEQIVILQVENQKKKVGMLVDSGADFSLIPLLTGNELGLRLAKAEPLQKAQGIGGSISYVLRNIQMTIDNYTFSAPVAWAQDESCEDIILGRKVVFDLFDIEFKQAEEKIVFKKRK